MKIGRFITHPILTHPRSRFICLCYIVAVGITCVGLIRVSMSMLSSAGVIIMYLPSDDNPILKMMLSPYTHLGLALAGVLIGCGMTAVYVVGPIKRMEQWIKDWQAGYEMKPFKLRGNDQIYENVVQMINALYEKRAGPKK